MVNIICTHDFDVAGDEVLKLAQPAEAARSFTLQYEKTVDLNAMFTNYLMETNTDGRTSITLAAGTDHSTLNDAFKDALTGMTLAWVQKVDINGAAVSAMQGDESNTAEQAKQQDGAGADPGTGSLALDGKNEAQIMKDSAGVAFFESWRAQNFDATSVQNARTASALPLSTAQSDTNAKSIETVVDGETPTGGETATSEKWITNMLLEAHSSLDGGGDDHVGRTVMVPAITGSGNEPQEDDKYKLHFVGGDSLYFLFKLDFAGHTVGSKSGGAAAQTARRDIVDVSIKLTQSS